MWISVVGFFMDKFSVINALNACLASLDLWQLLKTVQALL